MQPKIPLTQARLKELVNYDPETGIFTWRLGRVGCRAGAVAGSRHKAGYWQVGIDRKIYLLHRLAFQYMTGELPADQVDHINGVRTDTRWCNLRPVTSWENKHNIGGPPAHNTSGCLGVYWHKARRRWIAEIKLNGRKHHRGQFLTREEAAAAYLAAKDNLHPTHMRLREQADER